MAPYNKYTLSENEPWPGGGSEVSPFLISDVKGLRDLYERVTKNAIDYKYKYFRLTKDIHFKDSDGVWEPIGDNRKAFNGNFDGAFHIIYGLRINDGDYCGLFGYIGSYAAVTRLGVANCRIYGEAKGYAYGGITGTNNGRVELCFARVLIELQAAGSTKQCAIGGVTGINASRAVLKACFAGGEVTLKKAEGAVEQTDISVGGVVGSNRSENGICGCYANVKISAEAASTVGGVTGANLDANAVVSRCYTIGEIVPPKASLCASIVGENLGIIEKCFSTKAVSGKDTDGTVMTPDSMKGKKFADELNGTGVPMFAGQLRCYIGGIHDVFPVIKDIVDKIDYSNPTDPVYDFTEMCLEENISGSVILARGVPGTGTLEDPFQLSKPEEAWHLYCNKDHHIRLTANIDMNRNEFIKKSGVKGITDFTASLDGNKKTINLAGVPVSGTGFVIKLDEGAAVKNLSLNYDFVCEDESFSGLVDDNCGIVQDCSVTGKIRCKERGYGLARINRGTLDNCANKADIEVTVETSKGEAAGLTGENIGDIRSCRHKGILEMHLKKTDSRGRLARITLTDSGTVTDISSDMTKEAKICVYRT